MLFESTRQLPLFLVFICMGIMLGAVYDILSILRKTPALTAFSDLLFATAFLFFTVFFVERFNSGRLHFFMFFACLFGFVAERATLGFFIKIFIDFFLNLIYNLYVRLRIDKFFKIVFK